MDPCLQEFGGCHSQCMPEPENVIGRKQDVRVPAAAIVTGNPGITGKGKRSFQGNRFE